MIVEDIADAARCGHHKLRSNGRLERPTNRYMRFIHWTGTPVTVSLTPQRVTLTFGESVEVSADRIQVFDDHLKRVDLGSVIAVDAGHNRIQAGLRSGLSRGTYVVGWHVSSADTHPVSGTYRFSFGVQSVVSGKVPGVGRNDSAGFCWE